MAGLPGDLLEEVSVYCTRSSGSATGELRSQAGLGPLPSHSTRLPPYPSSFAFPCHLPSSPSSPTRHLPWRGELHELLTSHRIPARMWHGQKVSFSGYRQAGPSLLTFTSVVPRCYLVYLSDHILVFKTKKKVSCWFDIDAR